MKNFKKLAVFTFALILFSSCSSTTSGGGSDDDPGTGGGSSSDVILSKKVMVTNAGDGTDTESGTLTYIDTKGELTNNFFSFMNGDDAKLGANIKSITFDGNYNYIVSDQYIVLVDDSFIYQYIHYPVLSEPRYVLPVKGTTGYVLNWGTTAEVETPYINLIGIEFVHETSFPERIYDKFDFIVFDPETEKKPEKIILYQGNEKFKFFLTHFENNILTTIDFVGNNQEKSTLTLNDNLDDIVEVSGDKIAVLAKGNPSDASIYEIDALDNTVTTLYTFDSGDYPTAMVYANNAYYYSLGNNIYKLDDSSGTPTSVLDVTFTDFAIDGDLIYGVNTPSAGGTSTFAVYNLTTGAEVVASKTIGINANNVYLF